MDAIDFLEEWSRDYKLLQQKKLTRKDLAQKYHKSQATIGNWLKCYEEIGLPYKTLVEKWNEHGIKIIGIRKFMGELSYHFCSGNGAPVYIYYNKDKYHIWFQTEPTKAIEDYFLVKTKHNMYLSDLYRLIWETKKLD